MSQPARAPVPEFALTNPNVRNRSMPGSVMMDADAIDRIPWFEDPYLKGVWTKYLWLNLDSGMTLNLIRVSAGVRLPVHCHYSTAMLFCVKGRLGYDGGTIGPGGFGYEPFGVIHEPDSMGEETELFVLSSANALLQFYNEDGSLGGTYHVREALQNVRAELGDAAVGHLNLPDWYWED